MPVGYKDRSVVKRIALPANGGSTLSRESVALSTPLRKYGLVF